MALILVLSLPLFGLAQEKKEAPAPARPDIVITDKARAIHKEALLIDGHNDLPWELRTKSGLEFRDIDLTKSQPKFHTDLPRLREGNIGAQFWSAYVPSDTDKKRTAVSMTLEQIDVIHRFIARYPNDFELALGTADIERIRKSGKIACLIGIEGGHSIDRSLGVLRMYHKLGVRYMTLTHSDSLDWADAATDTPKAHGLSPHGETIIKEMNRIGMFVDLSHVSVETMTAALKLSQAPVIFSHSSARGVADHPRNVPDSVLPLVKANGGVIMVNFYSGFIVPEGARAMSKMFDVARELRKKYHKDEEYRAAIKQYQKENDYPRGTVHTIVDHIDHLVKHCGIDHVGIGSDFDGVPKLPRQMEDVSCYPYITQEMLNRGYSAEDIHKVLGKNLMRAFREMEKTAQKLQAGER